MTTPEQIKIAVSSCLLGNNVRYDGRHSRADDILEELSEYFTFIDICPEVGIGMGIPRPAINLVSINNQIRVRGVEDNRNDVTAALSGYAEDMVELLDSVGGYVFKSRSPSCGIRDVNVYDSVTAEVVASSAGQFAKAVMKTHPQLPVEDEISLRDKNKRQKFIERVMMYKNKE